MGGRREWSAGRPSEQEGVEREKVEKERKQANTKKLTFKQRSRGMHKVHAHDKSVACVFLPTHTPDFGKHSEIDTTDKGMANWLIDHPDHKCYCFHLYGEQKIWGCKW